MNDLDLIWELGQDTPLPDLAELSPARVRLAAAIAAGSAVGVRTAAAVPRRVPWPTRRLALIGNAALAALRLPDGAPRPDQFVYTKMRNGDGNLCQSWLSADGTRTGLVKGAEGGQEITIPGCRNGKLVHPHDNRNAPSARAACVPAPAYLPDMPASLKALRAYLDKTYGVRPGEPAYLNAAGKGIIDLLEQTYLSSGQRAALYELMADTPGFAAVPHAADITGRPGIGIAWQAPGGSGRNMIIFDATTYAELGITTRGAYHEKGGGALLKTAIVARQASFPDHLRPRGLVASDT